MNIILKKITKNDYSFLRDMLFEAIYNPNPKKPFSRNIIDKPELSKYINNWGKKGDIGFICILNNKTIGAAWIRLFTENDKSYGFVDEKIPEISMAVKKEYRNMGIGSKLLAKLLEDLKYNGYSSVSLSVDKNNRAVNLYKRFKFEIVEEFRTSFTMIKKL